MFAVFVLCLRSLSGKQINNEFVEFVVNGVIRKIFCTKSNDVVNDCLLNFNCVVSDAIYRKKIRFLNKFKYSNNSLCSLVVPKASAEISLLQKL